MMKKYILPEINVCKFKTVDIVTSSSGGVEAITKNDYANEHTFSSESGVEYVG